MADERQSLLDELIADISPENLPDEVDFGSPVGNEAGSPQILAERILRVLEFASSIYADASNLHEFMRRPHAMLGGESPIVCAVSSNAGADRVINLLGRAARSGGV